MMKYYVELSCEFRRANTTEVMVRPFVLYPVDQAGKFMSDNDVVLATSTWEDETGYVVWDLCDIL